MRLINVHEIPRDSKCTMGAVINSDSFIRLIVHFDEITAPQRLLGISRALGKNLLLPSLSLSKNSGHSDSMSRSDLKRRSHSGRTRRGCVRPLRSGRQQSATARWTRNTRTLLRVCGFRLDDDPRQRERTRAFARSVGPLAGRVDG